MKKNEEGFGVTGYIASLVVAITITVLVSDQIRTAIVSRLEELVYQLGKLV
jgi:hypothetical protein